MLPEFLRSLWRTCFGHQHFEFEERPKDFSALNSILNCNIANTKYLLWAAMGCMLAIPLPLALSFRDHECWSMKCTL
jgi:hypothetical protein